MHPEVLNSWKEIAAYLGRGVRTVQRWEQELGLPVRRPRGRERSAVIALKPDLDRWLHKTPHLAPPVQMLHGTFEGRAKMHSMTEELLERTQLLMQRTAQIHDIVTAALATNVKLLEEQTQRMRERKSNASQHRLLLRKTVVLATDLARGGGKTTHQALKVPVHHT